MPTTAYVGVGALASAIVTGLCEGVADPPTIVLSPRNAEASAALAARYGSVTVAADNQAVVDAADLVIVTLRRAHADVLGELTWRPEPGRGERDRGASPGQAQ